MCEQGFVLLRVSFVSVLCCCIVVVTLCSEFAEQAGPKQTIIQYLSHEILVKSRTSTEASHLSFAHARERLHQVM